MLMYLIVTASIHWLDTSDHIFGSMSSFAAARSSVVQLPSLFRGRAGDFGGSVAAMLVWVEALRDLHGCHFGAFPAMLSLYWRSGG